MEQTIEGNEAIAKFMNIHVRRFFANKTNELIGLIITDEDGEVDFEEFDFYSPNRDWRMLMPVFLKIGTMWHWQIDKFGCTIKVLDYKIEYGIAGADSNSEEKIRHCAWLAAVDFIQWCQNNKK